VKQIENTIIEFDLCLKKHNEQNYLNLYAPLSEKEVSNFMSLIGLENMEFKSLYLWKDGFDFNNDQDKTCQIFGSGTFLSLDVIKKNINIARDLWGNSFIPLISDNSGDFLLLNNKTGKNYGKLHLFSPSLLFADDPISYYDSIESMIKTTICCYEQGILSFDPGKEWLKFDIRKHFEIAPKFNPKSKYWPLAKKSERK
jgi:hypothetical protein